MANTTLLNTNNTAAPPIYRHGNSDILPAWSQREAAAAEQPWTATRCHRQLRPLLTHLMALRREKARAALKKRNEQLRQNASPNKRSTADDGLASRKRVRYTYSLKGTGRRRQERAETATGLGDGMAHGEKATRKKVAPLKQQATRTFCPGEVVVATPVLSRARKHRQAWSLPSSPIMHCTSAATADSGEGPSVATTNDTDTSPPKSKNPAFKYRGYYQSSLRHGVSSSASPSIDGDWAAVAKATPPDYHHLYESIFRAVDTLLRATISTLEPTRKSNSLLAMCLRKVPQYIAVCEKEEREEAEKEGTMQIPSSSVSLDIYSDLESLGGDSSGWKHLRVVVREHCIDILKSACTEGLLHDTFIRLLVRLCTHLKAYDEAESLIGALFDSHISVLPKSQHLFDKPHEAHVNLSGSAGPLASLGMMLQYADEIGRTSITLRQITEFLNSGHLPASWLSTQAFVSLWHRVVRVLSSRGSPVCEESILIEFVATAIAKLAQSRPDDDIYDSQPRANTRTTSSNTTTTSSLTSSSSYHTIVSIIGSICAVGILQKEAAEEETRSYGPSSEPAVVKRCMTIVQHALSEIVRKIKVRKGQHKTDTAAHCYPRQYLLMLALCLVRSKTPTDAEDQGTSDEMALRQFIESATSAQRSQLYDASIAMVTSVAENSGRGSDSLGAGVPAARAYLLELSTHAASYLANMAENSTNGNLTSRLQADAAFLLASRSNDLRDLAFAESLSKNSVQNDRHLSQPRDLPASAPTGAAIPSGPKMSAASTTALFDGYRWEEGISEWVVSTPRIPRGPSTRSTPKPKPRQSSPRPARKSELVVLIDSMPPSELAGENTKRTTTSGRLSLPTYFPPPSPSPPSGNKSDLEDSDSNIDSDSSNENNESNGIGTPSTPRTPTSQSDVSSCPRPKRSRRLGAVSSVSVPASSSVWHPQPRLRTTRSLLNLVPDDENDEEYQENEGSEGADIGNHLPSRNETSRLPFSGLTNNARNERTKRHSLDKSTKTALKGKVVAVRRISYQLVGGDADVASSDDELCL